MRIRFNRQLCVLATCIFFFDNAAWAGSVRLSFLNHEAALQNTVDFLKSQGCKPEALAGFQKAVERYNSTVLQLDLSKFPQRTDGFYSFPSTSQLLTAIPHKLCDLPHPFEFNCYDTVILLANGQLRTTLRPEEHRREFLAPIPVTEGVNLYYAPAATAREAFQLSCPAWYQNLSDDCIPAPMLDTRICLLSILYCFHKIPGSPTHQGVEGQVMNVLRNWWKDQGLEFPLKYQVVLCFEVSRTKPLFCTAHAGLLFPAGKGCIYIEKCGGRGPFVRLDFSDSADLKEWLASKYDECPCELVFATFNDNKIETLKIQH